MLLTLSLALLFTAVVGQAQSDCYGSFAAPNGWETEWTVSSDFLYATFTVRAPSGGWVGIGFSMNQIMPNTDMVIGAVGANGMGYTVTDRYAASRGVPGVDRDQNITDVSFEESPAGSGNYTMTFTRPICSNRDDDIALSEQPYILWASGIVRDDGSLQGHNSPVDRGVSPMRFDFICGADRGSFTTEDLAGTAWQIFWEVSPDAQTAAFEILARTTGWVGIGFSMNNLMTDSDIVVGAANDVNNMSYVSDRYAEAQTPPLVDTYQDLTYEAAAEIDVEGVIYTSVNFTRPTVNADRQDVPLNDDPIYILIAWGMEINYNGSDRMSIMRHAMANRAVLPNTYTFFTCGVIVVEPDDVDGTTAAPTATIAGSNAAAVSITTTLMLILVLVATMGI